MRVACAPLAIAGVLIATGVATRLVDHPWNVAPVTAVAIVAGMDLPFAHAIVLPLAIRIVSDAVIGFFAWPLMVAVYGCHILGAVVGRAARGRSFVTRAIGAPIVSAFAFFLLTNFAFLYREYPHTFSGVLLAYTNGSRSSAARSSVTWGTRSH